MVPQESFDDSLSGVAVAVGAARGRHLAILFVVGEQKFGGGVDLGLIGAD